jgi:hypothetical protein
MLSAMKNSDFRKVRPCQKSCNKPLHCHTTDRGAPCALYPAIKRSMFRVLSVVRCSLLNCDQTRAKLGAHQPYQSRICCSNCANSLLVTSCPSTTA